MLTPRSCGTRLRAQRSLSPDRSPDKSAGQGVKVVFSVEVRAQAFSERLPYLGLILCLRDLERRLRRKEKWVIPTCGLVG